jgi:hypothetical protein
MKAKELAQLLEIIVRKVVREEMKPILAEVKRTSKSTLPETRKPHRAVVKDPLDINVSELLKTERKKRPSQKFSNNPMLNDLLSETADSGEWRDMGDGFTSNNAQGFNRSAMAEMLGYGDDVTTTNNMVPNIDPEGRPMNVNIEGTAVGDALTRDYSALMKTINAKKRK